MNEDLDYSNVILGPRCKDLRAMNLLDAVLSNLTRYVWDNPPRQSDVDAVELMPNDELLDRYLEWHGLCGWAENLKSTVLFLQRLPQPKVRSNA